jgi:3-deoxy-D-manno-octulosonic acid kinase
VTHRVRPPAGFEAHRRATGLLVAATRHSAALLAAGLDDPRRWEPYLDAESRERPGRGATARLELADGLPLRLKQMRRGGLAAGLWRGVDFRGTRRLVDNLRVPAEASRRGIATPSPMALLIVPGGQGLNRGWLAVEEVVGAVDLARRIESGPPPTGDELSATMRLVRRMHDSGLEHTDLNLGNLLLRAEAGGSPEPFVIDLDGARLHDGGLSPRRRLMALVRLERSYLRVCGHQAVRGRFGYGPWYELYADGDPVWEKRLRRWSSLARLRLLFSAPAWRRRMQ